MWRDAATLLDIATAARRIAGFLHDTNQTEFATNSEKHWAVVSQLMIIGEAVTRLSDGFTSEHEKIEWMKISGLRNRLIHGYDKIRWNLVWDTAIEDVPALLSYIEPLIPDPPPDEPKQ